MRAREHRGACVLGLLFCLGILPGVALQDHEAILFLVS